MTDTPKKQEPEGFDHNTRRRKYEAGRKEHAALHYISRDGRPISLKKPIGDIPDGGFQGA